MNSNQPQPQTDHQAGLDALATLASATASSLVSDPEPSNGSGGMVSDAHSSETMNGPSTTNDNSAVTNPVASANVNAPPGLSVNWAQLLAQAARLNQPAPAVAPPATNLPANLAFLMQNLSASQQQQVPAPQHKQPDTNNLLLAMQNMTYYQLLLQQQQQNARNQIPSGSSQPPHSIAPKPEAITTPALNTSNLANATHHSQPSSLPNTVAALRGGAAPRQALSNAIPTSASNQRVLAPQPVAAVASRNVYDDDTVEEYGDSKKSLKRAANRKSAQLSRKRKKLFMEDLRQENDLLRRKEQILAAIPDLVVVFDSSGKLLYVSPSARKFFKNGHELLTGTSFWNCLCNDSVKLLKAAFMDSLALKQDNCDTVPLGKGVWELRLSENMGNHKLVALHGVMHFSEGGTSPECVCSMRPRYEDKEESIAKSVESRRMAPRVDPQQSVVTFSTTSSASSPKRRRRMGKNGEATRISDSCSSSGDSEDQSSEGLQTSSS